MHPDRYPLLLPFVFVAAAVSFDPAPARSNVLQLDFGPTTVTSLDLSNSALHSIKSSTGTSWNQVELQDISSPSLVYANGATATGVSLDLGRSTNSNTINFNTQPGSSSALATQVNSGVFGGTSVGRDGIFSPASGDNNHRIGLTLSGLPLGPYDVYVVAINTNISFISFNDSRRTMAVGALATAPSFDDFGHDQSLHADDLESRDVTDQRVERRTELSQADRHPHARDAQPHHLHVRPDEFASQSRASWISQCRTGRTDPRAGVAWAAGGRRTIPMSQATGVCRLSFPF